MSLLKSSSFGPLGSMVLALALVSCSSGSPTALETVPLETATALSTLTVDNEGELDGSQVDPARKIDGIQQVPERPFARNHLSALLPREYIEFRPIEPPKLKLLEDPTNLIGLDFDLVTGRLERFELSYEDDETPDAIADFGLGFDGSVLPEPELHRQDVGRTVIGSDHRIRISTTTSYPWRAMTKVYMTFPNGDQRICSGAMVSVRHVLTAGHCVYNADRGGWAALTVVPGQDGTYMPFGAHQATRIRTYAAWAFQENSNYDVALVTLNAPVGQSTGWLGYGYFPSINGVTGNLGGYPGDRDGGMNLYYHFNAITGSTSRRINYQIDTAGGQSGSGVYRILNGNRYVFGVHTNGTWNDVSGTNSGTRIDATKFSHLKNWIGSDL